MEVRRQARTALDRRQVAALVIVARPHRRNRRAGRARPPRPASIPCEPGRPIGLGRQQVPVGQRVALRPVRRRGNLARPVERMRRRHDVMQRAPERRVDLVRLPAARRHRPRRREIIAVVAHQIEPLRHRALGVAPPRLVVADGMDGARADLLGDLGEFLVALARAAGSAAIPSRANPGRAREAVMQPPPRRRAHRAMLRRLVVEDIDRDDRRRPGSPRSAPADRPAASPAAARRIDRRRHRVQMTCGCFSTIQVWPWLSSFCRSGFLPSRACAFCATTALSNVGAGSS